MSNWRKKRKKKEKSNFFICVTKNGTCKQLHKTNQTKKQNKKRAARKHIFSNGLIGRSLLIKLVHVVLDHVNEQQHRVHLGDVLCVEVARHHLENKRKKKVSACTRRQVVYANTH